MTTQAEQHVEEAEGLYTAASLEDPHALHEEDDEDEDAEIAADLEEELAAAHASLAEAEKETRAVADRIGRANAAIERRMGGDWKEITLVLGASIGGLALGYWAQKLLDKRIPWVGLAGVGLVIAGTAIKTRWSVRASLAVGGAMLAGGSTMFVFSLPPAPAPANGGMPT